jgi:hypothetical protein
VGTILPVLSRFLATVSMISQWFERLLLLHDHELQPSVLVAVFLFYGTDDRWYSSESAKAYSGGNHLAPGNPGQTGNLEKVIPFRHASKRN